MNEFLAGTLIVVGSIVFLKVFFTLWGPIHRKLNPDWIRETPETSFRALKNKVVQITLADGSVTVGEYERTLFFSDGEMGLNTVIFFQVRLDDGRVAFVSSASLQRIEETTSEQGDQSGAFGDG